MRPPTLLYISNDQFSLAGVKVFLESRGYRVLLARTCRYAWQMLNSIPFDAIVFDSDMGDYVTQQMTVAIRNQAVDTPILLLASHRYSSVRAAHCNAFCTKLDGNEALAVELTTLLSNLPHEATATQHHSASNAVQLLPSPDGALETN